MIAQFLKFSFVGVLNTALHYAVFYALYSVLGLHYLLASAIGYTAGLVNSYLLNRAWTFRSRDTNRKMQFAKFVCVNLVSLGVNLVALNVLVAYGGLRPEVAQILAIVFSLAANFVGNKFWTFRTVEGC